MQRLCEIETYKAMSMLGFARVREMGPVLGALDERLDQLIGRHDRRRQQAEQTLEELLTISAELEA